MRRANSSNRRNGVESQAGRGLPFPLLRRPRPWLLSRPNLRADQAGVSKALVDNGGCGVQEAGERLGLQRLSLHEVILCDSELPEPA